MVIIRLVRLPITRPLWPRTSSAASGFFFCGMIDEPVERLSGRRMKPKGWLAHRISSSARRERCSAVAEQHHRKSSAKSRSETESSELAVGASKPSAAAVIARSIGKPVPASAALPSGHSFIRARASARRERSRRSIS